MHSIKIAVAVLCLVLTQACGSERVTLRLVPGMGSASNQNLIKTFSPLSPLMDVSYSANFCSQTNALAAAFYEHGSTSSELISVKNVGIATAFYEDSAISDFSEVVSALNSPYTRISQNIELNVPTGSEIGVGMMGLIKLGDPSASSSCSYSEANVGKVRYATFSGSLKINPSTNMNVYIPMITAPSRGTLTLSSGQLSSFQSLNTIAARNEFLMVWIKLPPGNCASENTVNSLSLKIDPGNIGSLYPIDVELENNKSYGNGTNVVPTTPTPGAAATGIFTGYLIPHADLFVFTLNYNLADSIPVPPCLPGSGTDTTVTLSCVRPDKSNYMVPGSNSDGIQVFVADFVTNTCHSI